MMKWLNKIELIDLGPSFSIHILMKYFHPLKLVIGVVIHFNRIICCDQNCEQMT